MTEQSSAERMQELLAFANYSKVARALDVSKSAVSAWARGRDVTPYRLEQVEKLLVRMAPAIAEPAGEYDAGEEPMPAWAKRLYTQVIRNEAMLLTLQRRLNIPDHEWHEAIADVLTDREVEEFVEARLGRAPSAGVESPGGEGTGPDRSRSAHAPEPAARGHRRGRP